jgi:hypothetical protein
MKSDVQDLEAPDDILGDGTLMVDISGDGGVVKRIIKQVTLRSLMAQAYQSIVAVITNTYRVSKCTHHNLRLC